MGKFSKGYSPTLDDIIDKIVGNVFTGHKTKDKDVYDLTNDLNHKIERLTLVMEDQIRNNSALVEENEKLKERIDILTRENELANKNATLPTPQPPSWQLSTEDFRGAMPNKSQIMKDYEKYKQ